MQGSSTITNCKAGKGGGVHVSGGTFKMQDSAVVTPSTEPEQYTAGKNDVYLESRKTITIDGSLSSNPAARITPREYTAGHSYLTGSGVGTYYSKFTVTPEKVTEDSENWNVFWYVAANGTLKAAVEDSSTLQSVINSRSNDTPFIIKLGNISNLETVEIPEHKKIMLKADTAVTLTCPKKWNDYKHLHVKGQASLTLKGQIKLQGTDYGYQKGQYALYVETGGTAEIKNGVTITEFKNSWFTNGGRDHDGKGPVFVDGTLTMSGGRIEKNIVDNLNGSLSFGGGGSVYVGATGKFIMKGGTITQNKASGYNTSNGGGGVYVKGQFTMEGGTIEENTADKGGGVYSQGEFTMKGGTITKNTATNNGKAIMLNYYFHWEGGEIKDNQGNGSVIGGNVGYYLHNTSGNTDS